MRMVDLNPNRFIYSNSESMVEFHDVELSTGPGGLQTSNNGHRRPPCQRKKTKWVCVGLAGLFVGDSGKICSN